jgi:lipoprotein-anchoring transpeptidase ErfK/SrfK
MVEKSKLSSLSYTSVLELLGERFHASPKLLQRLNPTATFAAGEEIVVPNVEPFSVPEPKTETTPKAGAKPTESAKPASGNGSPAGPEMAVTVIVTDRTKTLQVQDAAGKVLFHAPVTVGSENDPLPVGEWKINGVGRNPVFNYNPDLFWDADPAHAKAKIPAGPNNPVGVVWIDLSKEHYGIHGTPEPSRVGHTESHGCIRLTNWDAMRVAGLVKAGTKVILR